MLMFKNKDGKVVAIGSTGVSVEDTIAYEVDENNEEYLGFIARQKYTEEIISLEDWLYETYKHLESDYLRLIRMNQNCDDGSSPVEKLNELDTEAETKRKRIIELKNKLK